MCTALVNLLKSCEVFSILVPNTGSDSIAPLKLRRLSVVLEVAALNCLRFRFLFLDLSLPPVVAGVLSVGVLAVAGALSVGVLADMLDVARVTVGVLAANSNANPLSDFGHCGDVSSLSNFTAREDKDSISNLEYTGYFSLAFKL